MRYAEADPRSRFRPKSRFGGIDRTIDPRVLENLTFIQTAHHEAFLRQLTTKVLFGGTLFCQDNIMRDQDHNKVE